MEFCINGDRLIKDYNKYFTSSWTQPLLTIPRSTSLPSSNNAPNSAWPHPNSFLRGKENVSTNVTGEETMIPLAASSKQDSFIDDLYAFLNTFNLLLDNLNISMMDTFHWLQPLLLIMLWEDLD